MGLLKLPTILLTFADARDDLPGLKKESSALHDVLLPLQQDGLANIEREESATLEEVFKRIVDYKNDMIIFHYAGHADRDELFMEENEVAARNIAALLGQAPYLQLVFLNGCETADQAKLFLDNGVKIVVATYNPVSDRLAEEFAKGFYYALSNDYSIGSAYEAARRYVTKQTDRKGPSRGFQLEGTAEKEPWALFVKEGGQEYLNWKISYRDKARLNLLLGSRTMIQKLMRGAMGSYRQLINSIIEGRTLWTEINEQEEALKNHLESFKAGRATENEEESAESGSPAEPARFSVLGEALDRLCEQLGEWARESLGHPFAEAYLKQPSLDYLEEVFDDAKEQRKPEEVKLLEAFMDKKFGESQYVNVKAPGLIAEKLGEHTQGREAVKKLRKIVGAFLIRIQDNQDPRALMETSAEESGSPGEQTEELLRQVKFLMQKLEELHKYLGTLEEPLQEEDPLSLKVAVESLWGNAAPHIRLSGPPGAGKTSAVIQLWADLLRRAQQEKFSPIPIFVNLSDYRGAEEKAFIKTYVAKHYLELPANQRHQGIKAFEEILDQPLEQGENGPFIPSVLLFLDGEIHPLDSFTLDQEIRALQEKKGLQMIFCCGAWGEDGRGRHAPASFPVELEICPMTTEEIQMKIGTDRLQSFRSEIREMIRNRKWLARLFEFYNLIGDERLEFKEKFLTEGELLWNYFEAKLARVISSGESIQLYIRRFYLRHFIPKILFRMHEQGKREIREDRLFELIQEISTQLYQRSFLQVFPEYRRYFKYFLLNAGNWVEAEERFAVITKMCEDYGILIPISRFYTCTNQEVFDFFAAVHLHNEIVQSTWKAKYAVNHRQDEIELPAGLREHPLPPQMLRFLGQIEGLHHSFTDLPMIKMLERCRSVISRAYGQQMGSTVYNILVAWKETNGYYPRDLSRLDLRDIDLSRLSQPLEERPFYLPCDLEGVLIRREDVLDKSKRKVHVADLDYTPDGETLICALSDGTIRLWDMEFLICYRIINAHPGQAVQAICSVDINGDPHIVSASESEIRIWDQKKTKTPLMRISKKEDGSVFPEPLLSLSCWIDQEENEAYLWIAAAGGGRDNALVIWKVDPAKMPEAESVEWFKHFALHEDDVKSLAVSPDHTRLVSGSWDNKVRVLDVKEKREDKALTERHVSRINGVAFSDDGRYIASASNDDTIIIWDWRQDDRYRRLAGHYRDVNSVRFKKIDGGQYLISGGDDGQLILWNLEEIWQHPGPLVKDDELDVSRMDFNTEVNCLQFAPDGNSIAAGNQSGEVCLLDLEAGKLREGARFDNTHFLLVHGCRFAGLHPESDLLKNEEDKQLLRQYGAIIPEQEGDDRDAERWRRMICKLSGEILREENVKMSVI